MRQETFPDCLGYRFNRYFPAIDRKGVGDAAVAENFGKDFGMLVSPFIIGRVGQKHGMDGAFFLCSAAFLLSGLLSTLLPETKGKQLD